MKNIKSAVTTIVLSTLSFGVFAVESVSPTWAQNMNKIDAVSADGATTLDSLGTKLAEKTNAAGATGYSITSTIGKDKMNGTAIVYK